MTDTALSQLHAHLAPDGLLIQTVLCPSCGYDLRGIAVAGVCPECGAPVSEALLGDQLKFADMAFVRRIHRGAILIETGVVVALCFAILLMPLGLFLVPAGVPGRTIGMSLVSVVGGLLPITLIVVGWYLFSSVDEATPRDNRIWKTSFAVRLTLLVLVLTTLASFCLQFLPSLATMFIAGMLGLASTIALLALLVTSTCHLIQLGKRLPQVDKRRNVRRNARRFLNDMMIAAALFVAALIVQQIPSLQNQMWPVVLMIVASVVWLFVVIKYIGLIGIARSQIGKARKENALRLAIRENTI